MNNGDYKNPYDSLVAFISRHRIDAKEEQRLREIIKNISAHEESKENERLKRSIKLLEQAREGNRQRRFMRDNDIANPDNF